MSKSTFTLSEAGHQVPEYGTQPEKPGIYLALFHGRDNPDDQMDDWGFDGPLIGPLEWFHTTYAYHYRLQFICQSDEARYFKSPRFPDCQDILMTDDMITYGGKHYGDWTVFYVSDIETQKPSDTFRNMPRRAVPFRIDVKKPSTNSPSKN